MIVVAIYPILICLLGAIIYALSTSEKPKEIGRLIFAVGLLFTVYALAGHVLRLG